MKNEEDLRVQRTRRLLRKAIIELMKVEPYEAITIRAITKQAKVGYKTFFRHYESKEALLQAMFQEVIEGSKTFLLPPTVADAPQQNTLNVLRHAQTHADFILTILRSPIAPQLLEPFMALALAEGNRFFSGSQVPDELVAYHFASTMRSFLQWWLEHNCPYSPEEMVEYINLLLLEPISRLPTHHPTGSTEINL